MVNLRAIKMSAEIVRMKVENVDFVVDEELATEGIGK